MCFWVDRSLETIDLMLDRPFSEIITPEQLFLCAITRYFTDAPHRILGAGQRARTYRHLTRSTGILLEMLLSHTDVNDIPNYYWTVWIVFPSHCIPLSSCLCMWMMNNHDRDSDKLHGIIAKAGSACRWYRIVATFCLFFHWNNTRAVYRVKRPLECRLEMWSKKNPMKKEKKEKSKTLFFRR